jgi:DNA modification methylase
MPNELKPCLFDLRQGDCLELIKDIPDGSVNLTVTSPPYFNAREYSHWETYSDFLQFLKNIFLEIFRVTKQGRMCCVNISTIIVPREKRNAASKRIPLPFHFVNMMEEIGFTFLEDIIWVKPEGAAKNRNGKFYSHRQPVAYKPNVVTEYIFVFQKPAPFLIDKILRDYPLEIKSASLVKDGYERGNVWYINPDTRSKHPAPYPEKLCDNLVRYYSYKCDTVLDPFMGSGTTGVACVRTNRNFIGMELDEKYFAIAKDRLEQESKR